MKKAYKKPQLELVEYRFSDHIAASGTSDCYWSSGATWSHAATGCNTNYHPGTEGYVGLNG